MTEPYTIRATYFGNLGADPTPRILRGRTVTRKVYDPAHNAMVPRELTSPSRVILTASLAQSRKDENGKKLPAHWTRLVDFQNLLVSFRRGDRIKVRGYFRDREYVRDGITYDISELVVTAVELQRRKLRQPAA